MATTQYVGARYVPEFADPVEWSSDLTYEPLTIVIHEGNSYTSKQFVPKGIDIDNHKFWALTGNYNAQVEGYRQEVSNVKNNLISLNSSIKTISDFEGETSQDKFFNALDTMEYGTLVCGDIIIDKRYTAKDKDYRNITIANGTVSLNVNNWFNQQNSKYNSVPLFNGCYIKGNGNTMYDNSANCVGAYFNGCTLDNVTVFNSTSGYMQSLYVVGCLLNSVGRLCRANVFYDLKITSSRVESSAGILIEGIDNAAIRQGVVDDCLIEGRSDVVFQFGGCFGFTIKNCYFEANNSGIVKQTYSLGACHLLVTNNAFYAPMENTDYAIQISSSAYAIAKVSNNVSNFTGSKYLANISYDNISHLNSDNYMYSGGTAFSNNYFGQISKNIITGEYDNDNSEWIFILKPTAPTDVFFNSARPFYVTVSASYGSSIAYRGFAILKCTPRTFYNTQTGNVENICDIEIVDSVNSNNKSKQSSVSATIELSSSRYQDHVDYTLRVKGFNNLQNATAVLTTAGNGIGVSYA